MREGRPCAPSAFRPPSPRRLSPRCPRRRRTSAPGRWIDLTHPFNEESVYWPTAEMFELEEVFHGHTEGGWYYTAYNFSAAEHGGTHLDSPIHFAEGGLTADAIPVEQMIGPGFVIDVSAAARRTSTTG